MKMKSAIFAWMTLMLLNGCGLITPGQKKSVSESQKERPVVHVPLADPFILLHDGTYYAYGTKAEHGIAVFESDDLQTWRQASGRAAEGLALHKDDVYGDRWFWAPEVYCINGAFYMFFSAQSHVCVAVSDSPLGPFVQKEKKPMIEYKFDTQLLIEGHDLDEDAIHDYILANIAGDCLLAVGDEDLIKIHFHTNTPWKVLEYCASLGEIYDIVVEDMDRQERGLKG